MIIFAVGDKGLHPHRRVALRIGADTHGERHAPEHPLSAPPPFPGSEAQPWRTPQEVLRAHIQQVCGRISLRWSLPQAEIALGGYVTRTITRTLNNVD